MNIFVHSASECLTDHLPHGEGLICDSLFRALLDRGHSIWTVTKTLALKNEPRRLTVVQVAPRAPFHTLHSFEYNFRINCEFRRWVSKGVKFDLIWRQAPFGPDCSICPALDGLPLAIGPIYYPWPGGRHAQPRFGLTIRPLFAPLAALGWRRTLQRAELILGSTPNHARKLRDSVNMRRSCSIGFNDVPVIVRAPDKLLAESRTRPPNAPSVRLAFVAGLRENKRPLVVCETVDLLRRKGVDAHLVVCGDGPLAETMKRLAADGGWGRRLEMKSNVANSEVFEILSRSDILISTAVGEPYGRNIVEAMSIGTPAIAHRSGGPAEIIGHDIDGWLVDESSSEAFATAVLRIAEPNTWNRLSRGALSTARQWRPEVVGEKLERLFGETIARHKACGNGAGRMINTPCEV